MKKENNKTNRVTHPVSLITLADRTSPISEQYRTIRTNIQFAMADREVRTLVVTSSGPSEGKSTSAANLAVVFANSGVNTLLVDADMRKPTVAKSFALPNHRGLSNLLSNRNTNILDYAYITGVDHLSILTSGPKPPRPSEMLGSIRMNQLLKDMQMVYDLVIFDMPPVVTVTDAQVMSTKVDGTILVVREGVSEKASAIKAKELLDIVKANVLGVIYNGSTRTSDQSYYYYGV